MADYPAFVEELVPPGSVREQLYWWQVRRKVRYICFRLQTEADPEAPERSMDDVPEGFKEFFEAQVPDLPEDFDSDTEILPGQWFDGWENFGKTWDVGGADSDFAKDRVKNPNDGSDSPLDSVPRWTTVWEDNEDEMNSHMRLNELQARKRRRRGIQSDIQRDDKAD